MKKILLVDAAEKVGCTVRDILRLSKASDDYSPSPYILWATLEDGSASHLDYMGNPMPHHKKIPIGACTTLLLPEQIHTILRRGSTSLTAYYRDAESLSKRIDEYWALTPAQTVTSADVSISEDDLPKLLELLKSEKTLELTPAASSPVSKLQVAPASGLTPAELRLRIDITAERGGRRRILEKWNDIENEYGPKIDGRQVQRVLNRDRCEKQITLKTIQNHLAKLRREGLIP